MEFFRAGEALIRSSQPLLLPFLTPTAYRTPARIGAGSRQLKSSQWQCQSSVRTFSSSHNQYQQSGTAASPIAQLQDSMQPTRHKQQRDDFTDILDGALDLDKGVPGAPRGRTSRFASNTAQKGTNQYNDPRSPGRPMSSVDQLVGDLQAPLRQRKPAPSSNSAASQVDQVDSILGGIARGNARSSSTSNVTMDIESIFSAAQDFNFPAAPDAKAPEGKNDPAPMKLNSSTGRIIRVNQEKGIDAARAFRMLGMRLAQNNVKRDFQKQRFHERPGLKRKRLKSQRWRIRFKEAFKGTVSRVVALKRQGW